MTPFEKQEMDSYQRIYHELGGVLDDTNLASHELQRKHSLKSDVSQKYRSSLRSSMFSFKDEEQVYRNVDALISEAIAIQDLAFRQLEASKNDEAAENLCRAARYFRMLLSKIPEENSRCDEVHDYIQSILQKAQLFPGCFGGRVLEHIEGETLR